ncbi:hypothetical protein H2198_007763 [Neophaeococcomyces mojaviensis]|uniref:Uncharacterized protein n=1 Tax=Neophaeococcomyces mojaviensis TaxID=3383035 RepID=A0ACC2ZZJ2_9EURO|nr:hypothetical protein H2198_007763 [Knufia sp. JES_112]
MSKIAFALVLVLAAASAYPASQASERAATGTDPRLSTFADPPARVRPRFRYWVPDASVDLETLQQDIVSASSVGAGGVELLGIYDYGFFGVPTPIPDWDTYAWGTPAWQAVLKRALQTHKDHNLSMDFAIGPSYGQGVPVEPDSQGLAWDIKFFNATITPGNGFTGVIPGWGTGQLIGLTSAAVTSVVHYNVTAPSNPLTGAPATIVGKVNYTLASSSLKDHTAALSSNGEANLVNDLFPTGSGIEQYRLFATYIYHSYTRATAAGPNPQNFIQNGSFAVDHFSATGAQTTTDFWDQYLLFNDTTALLKEVGNFAWEDSTEINSLLYWTPALPQTFEDQHGYDIIPYIPVLLNGNNVNDVVALLYEPTGPPEFFWLDESDSGFSHIDDYRSTLGSLYAEYLGALKSWSNQRLGLNFSAQVGYNMPMDVLAQVPDVDAPELESLGFQRIIDNYRQYVGPANLAGKRVISDEVGAVQGGVYQLTMPELLWDIKRAFAAGVNQMVIHGLPYSGNFSNTTWPSFTTFSYLFAEMHGPHQPAWRHYSNSLNFIGRSQSILQSGVPKRDLAIYQKDSKSGLTTPKYFSDDLVRAGYAYEYLSPDNFALPEVHVADGSLSPNGPAYKAMLLRGNDSMTLFGAQKLVEYAQAGLPIIVQGGIPTKVIGSNANEKSEIPKVLGSLTALPSIHQISWTDSVAEALQKVNVQPRALLGSGMNSIYTNWRRDAEAGTDYIYVYSDNTANAGTITFQSKGTPYYFDAWTGNVSAIANYTRTSDGRTSIYINLAGNQTTIVGFTESQISGIRLPSSTSSPAKCQPTTTTTQTLTNWNLTITEFAPPTDLLNVQGTIYKNHSFTSLSSPLQSWSSISSSMTNVSGIGTYTTTFTLTSASSSGAFVDFTSPIYHTIHASVNNRPLPPLDLAHARADITEYLNPVGQVNLLTVEVATPLYNELRPIWYQLRTVGVLAGHAVPVVLPAQENGLNGIVEVEEYVRAAC